MRIDFDNIGERGIITDKPDYELDLGVWSDGRNVRFQNGVAIKMKGHSDAFSATASISISAMFSLALANNANTYWAYASKDKVYATDGASHLDVSHADYSATADINWTGGVFGGIGILNNGVNVPMQWGDDSEGPSLTKTLKPLENWSSTSSTTCRFIRPFKNYLVAGDINENGNRNPRLLHWSHPAPFGTIPSSWDYADTTKDAGRYEFSETNDFLVDCMALNDVNIIYKEHSTWGMQFIGAPSIFRFYQIFSDLGALSRRCSAVFSGSNHAVFGHNDIYIHNGQTLQSIAEKRIKDWVYNQIDQDTYVRSFVVPYYVENEIWFCFPQSGSAYPNLAMVWNYLENTTTIRELDNISHIDLGIIPTTGVTWSGSSETWDTKSGSWDSVSFNPTLKRLLGTKPSSKKIFQLDSTEQEDGSNMTSYVTRLGLNLSRINQLRGQLKNDTDNYKTVYNVFPRIKGTEGGVLNVYIGTQLTPCGTVTWSTAKPFTIGTSTKIDILTSGRLIGIKFQSTTNISWTLNGFGVEVDVMGDQ